MIGFSRIRYRDKKEAKQVTENLAAKPRVKGYVLYYEISGGKAFTKGKVLFPGETTYLKKKHADWLGAIEENV